MEDLFEQAARADQPRGDGVDDVSEYSVGGHRLQPHRQLTFAPETQCPRSVALSPRGRGGGRARDQLLTNIQESDLGTHDDEESEGYDDTDEDDGLLEVIEVTAPQPQGQLEQLPPPNLHAPQAPPNLPTPQAQQLAPPHLPAPQAQPPQPFRTLSVPQTSALCTAAINIYNGQTFSMTTALEWQSAVNGNTASVKQFHSEALQELDLVVFASLGPSSTVIQLVHSAATFAAVGGDPNLRGKDFAFLGDRTDIRPPTPVLLGPGAPWKWIQKKIILDVGPLEQFYAVPGNARKLWAPEDRTGEQEVALPRLLYLPPPFVVFCLTAQRTPFELHQFVAQYATQDGADATIAQCWLILDWCVMASQQNKKNTLDSIVAIMLPAAPEGNPSFQCWLLRRLENTLGAPPLPPMLPTQQVHPAMPPQVGQPPPLPPGPPIDIWATMAANISQGIATAAAALHPHPGGHTMGAASYEDGGKPYDEFQMAVFRGFAHSANINMVPRVWPYFQCTKHADTHKDIRREMVKWATSQRIQVAIDQNLFIPTSTLRDILSLKFNPSRSAADVDDATKGISMLVCRVRSNEGKSALRKREEVEEKSRGNWTLADAEKALPDDHTTSLCPEDYNELLRCLGTYCAFLHSLFGK